MKFGEFGEFLKCVEFGEFLKFGEYGELVEIIKAHWFKTKFLKLGEISEFLLMF